MLFDLRWLAVFRILLGLTILSDTLMMLISGDVGHLLSDTGIYPRHLFLAERSQDFARTDFNLTLITGSLPGLSLYVAVLVMFLMSFSVCYLFS